jgi:hypothetical protein
LEGDVVDELVPSPNVHLYVTLPELMAEVLVCQSDLVRRSVLLFSSMGLNIDVISSQSQRPAEAGL